MKKNIAAVIFVLIACVCVAAQNAEWQTVTPANDVFSVSFPCAPTLKSGADSPLLKDYSEHTCVVKSTVFMLQRTSLTGLEASPSKARMDDLNKNYVQGIGAKEFTQSPLTLGNYGGRASTFTLKSGTLDIDFKTQIYFIAGKTYSLAVGVRSGSEFAPEVEKFFASASVKK